MVFDLEVRVGSDLLNKHRIICLAYMYAEKLTIILPSSKLIIKLKLYFLPTIFLQEILKLFLSFQSTQFKLFNRTKPID